MRLVGWGNTVFRRLKNEEENDLLANVKLGTTIGLVVGLIAVAGLWLSLSASSSSLFAAHDGFFGDAACAATQLAAQQAVNAGAPYQNHGKMVSTAAKVVSAAEEGGTIGEECASCIMHQFAQIDKGVEGDASDLEAAVAAQQPCGPTAFACEPDTCGNFDFNKCSDHPDAPCNGLSGTTLCALTPGGNGVCVGNFSCAASPGNCVTNGNADCPAGSQCLISTCCGAAICTPPAQLCGGVVVAGAPGIPTPTTGGTTVSGH